MAWKFGVAPGAVGFLNGGALGGGYANDLFVGAATGNLEGGQLFRLNLAGAARRGFAFDDPRLADLVGDNPNKFSIIESESLLFGRDFGVATDIQTGPNGNLFVVSLLLGEVYEIFDAGPPEPGSGACPTGGPTGPGPGGLTLGLEAKKQKLQKKLKLFATASADSTLIAEGKAIKETMKDLAANQTTKVRSKLKRKQKRKLARKLDRKGKAKTKVEATATDQRGVMATDELKVKLRD